MLAIDWLGRVGYGEALELQRKAVEARIGGAGGDRLLLLEHPPVITLGRSARGDSLLVSRDALAARGIEVHDVARGGDATYHGPGQLVGYAIVDLQARGAPDVHRFLRALEAALGDALRELGVRPHTRPGFTGVFVEPGRGEALGARPRKIASIGLGLRAWVTFHGFALNVDLDPADFGAIVPCGLRDVEMTSVARELGARAPARLSERARDAVGSAFARRLG